MKSYSPTETPPGGKDEVTAQRRLDGAADFVLDIRRGWQHHRHSAVGEHHGGQAGGVAVDDLARFQGLVDFYQLISRRQDGDRRSPVDGYKRTLQRGQDTDFAGSQDGAGRHQDFPRTHVLAATADMGALFFRRHDVDTGLLSTGLVKGPGVFDLDNGVDAGRDGSAGHDAAGLPVSDFILSDCSGGDFLDDLEAHRILFRGAGDVVETDGVAIHGGVVVRRVVVGRLFVTGEYSIQGIQ